MGKRTSTIEWRIAKDDAEWAQLCASSFPAAPNRQPTVRLRWNVVVLLLCLGCAGVWWRYTPQARQQQPTGAATATAQHAGTLVAQPADHATTASSANLPRVAWLDPYAPVVTRLQESLNLSGRLALTLQPANRQGAHVARVTLVDPVGVPFYRQTRFYQHTGRAWVRVAPNAALWGAPQQLATPFFIFHFRRNDAAAVTAVAPQVDALYTRLQRDYGLPMRGIEEKVTIAVSVTQFAVTYAPSQLSALARMDVPSPALYLAPVELTDAQLLAQSLALPLIKHVSIQAGAYYGIGPQWQPLLEGLRLWQVWDMALPLASGHEEVVQWVHTGRPTSYPSQPILLPATYTALCATHERWEPSPLQMGAPLHCLTIAEDEWFVATWRPRSPLTRLNQLITPAPYSSAEFLEHTASAWGQTVAAATLIEYAVSAHGREQLPVLVAGLRQAKTWDALLTSVYGVSAAEFETGWQAYVAMHYGVKEIRSE